MDRIILHSDINSFYASVECLKNPELRNVPMAVGGSTSERHGIIYAKNDLVKKADVKQNRHFGKRIKLRWLGDRWRRSKSGLANARFYQPC